MRMNSGSSGSRVSAPQTHLTAPIGCDPHYLETGGRVDACAPQQTPDMITEAALFLLSPPRQRGSSLASAPARTFRPSAAWCGTLYNTAESSGGSNVFVQFGVPGSCEKRIRRSIVRALF